MNTSTRVARRGLAAGFAACALGGVVTATVALPTAAAQPGQCSASNFATTASGVLNAAGGYLATHPEADRVLTDAASQPTDRAESAVRGYFTAHPGEYLELQSIARPLSDLRNQCGTSITPSQLAVLVDALSD